MKLAKRGVRFSEGRDMDIMQGVKISEVMKSHPVTIHKDQYFSDAMALFQEKNLLGFPVLADKLWQMAGTLSGGQKRMLTIARGLMSDPDLLLLDDPFLGLAPKDVNRLCDALKQIRRYGITLFLAGQHVRRILRVATKAFLVEEGRITLAGTGEQLLGHPHLRETLFGIVAESGIEIP